MNQHVVDQFADYLEDRVSAEERARIDAHLAACEECATDYAFARDARDAAARDGLRHLSAGRIVELASGGSTPTPEEEKHLERCEECRDELDWMRRTPPAGEALADKVIPGPASRRRWGPWLLLAATIAGIVLWPRGPEVDHLDRFATLEPIPVRLSRDVPVDAFEQDRQLGLERYTDRDWTGARVALERALAARPGDEQVGLYLASAELLDGDRPAAVARLRPLAASASDPRVRDEAAWQLANALLLADDGGEAERLLRDLAAGEGRHAAAARETLERIPSGR